MMVSNASAYWKIQCTIERKDLNVGLSMAYNASDTAI
jgi:hypothetical protein